MDVPGRWAGGFRAWDDHGVYLATGRGVERRTGARACRPRCCAACRDAWFPFGGHLIEGVYRTARTIESTARQREALVTLGTLAAGLAHEINNPAAAATRAADALGATCDALLVVAGPARARRDHGRPVRRARRAAPRGRPGAGRRPRPARARRPGGGARRRGWRGTASSDEWTLAPPLAAAGVDVAWCERVAAVLDGPALRAGADVGGEHVRGRDAARRGQRVHAADLRAGRRGAVLLPDGPGVAAADRRHRRPREHAGDARPQAPATA